MSEAPGDPAAARRARRQRGARAGGTALLLLLGVVGFPGPLSIAGFAGLAALWWGRPLAMVGLFGVATAVAFFATDRPSRPTDDLERDIGPPATPAVDGR
jgi:hypothetical protein